jgi:hypothetical protein
MAQAGEIALLRKLSRIVTHLAFPFWIIVDCIESELLRSRLTGTVVPFASDTALTLFGCNHERARIAFGRGLFHV